MRETYLWTTLSCPAVSAHHFKSALLRTQTSVVGLMNPTASTTLIGLGRVAPPLARTQDQQTTTPLALQKDTICTLKLRASVGRLLSLSLLRALEILFTLSRIRFRANTKIVAV